MKPKIITALLVFFATQIICKGELNIAKPNKHPYVDPAGGRENYKLSGEKVNEARVYDFYQRQADYYMANPNKTPDILPSYPGLDAGLHGCLLYTSPSPRDVEESRMPSSA